MTSGGFLSKVATIPPIKNVTGPRATSARTRSSIAAFATGKAFGVHGRSDRIGEGAFMFGRGRPGNGKRQRYRLKQKRRSMPSPLKQAWCAGQLVGYVPPHPYPLPKEGESRCRAPSPPSGSDLMRTGGCSPSAWGEGERRRFVKRIIFRTKLQDSRPPLVYPRKRETVRACLKMNQEAERAREEMASSPPPSSEALRRTGRPSPPLFLFSV